MKSPISLQTFITFVCQIFSSLFLGFFSECVMFSHFIEFQTNDLQRHPILGLYNHVHSILHPLQPNKSTHQDGFYERVQHLQDNPPNKPNESILHCKSLKFQWLFRPNLQWLTWDQV